jgi:hypothetical protein
LANYCDYSKIDEEDLAKETEWIRVKHRGKKRKINSTSSPPTTAELCNKKECMATNIFKLFLYSEGLIPKT